MDTLFHGVNVAAITPQRAGSPEADLAAALDLLDHLEKAGVGGIALAGTTGEFLHYSIEERTRLLSFAVKRVRIPILAGVTHSSLAGTLALASQAIEAGAAGLLFMPPYFFRYGPADLLEFFGQVAERLDSAVPRFLYNIPFFTSPIPVDVSITLLSEGLYAGIKDSSGDLAQFEQLRELRERKPFTLLVGNDVIYTKARQRGAHGVVSGVACAVPELMLGLTRAIDQGQAAKTERLEARLQEFIVWLHEFPVPIGVKEAVAARGLTVGPHAIPLPPATEAKRREFRAWLEDWIPTVLAEAAAED